MKHLTRYMAIRFLGTFFYVSGGLVALPWTIGAVAASEYMLAGSFLKAGIASWTVLAVGVAIMRSAEAYRRLHLPNLDPRRPFRKPMPPTPPPATITQEP